MKLFDGRTGADAHTVFQAGLRGIAFDPSGANVVVTFEDAVVAFDARTGKSLAEFRHDARITGMVTTADLAFMATTALDGTSRIWNVRKGAR